MKQNPHSEAIVLTDQNQSIQSQIQQYMEETNPTDAVVFDTLLIKSFEPHNPKRFVSIEPDGLSQYINPFDPMKTKNPFTREYYDLRYMHHHYSLDDYWSDSDMKEFKSHINFLKIIINTH